MSVCIHEYKEPRVLESREKEEGEGKQGCLYTCTHEYKEAKRERVRRGYRELRWDHPLVVVSPVDCNHIKERACCWIGEHRVVAAITEGRGLEPDEKVHHIDGDKLNNRPENLAIVCHREHKREHWLVFREVLRLRRENKTLRRALSRLPGYRRNGRMSRAAQSLYHSIVNLIDQSGASATLALDALEQAMSEFEDRATIRSA